MQDKLTPKQEKFVRNLIQGMSQREAYKDAYDASNMKDETIDTEACLLFKDQKITNRYKELQDELYDATIMTAKERMKLLTDIALRKTKEKDKVVTIEGKVVDIEKDANLTTIIKALDILNKMSGEYTQKVEANVNQDININIELSDEE